MEEERRGVGGDERRLISSSVGAVGGGRWRWFVFVCVLVRLRLLASSSTRKSL
jgi:hypothetical protein